MINPAHLDAKRPASPAKRGEVTTNAKRFSGFTLIELLIVIAILGILSAAVLVAVNPAKRQNQARDAQTKGDIGSIATGLQAYFTSNSGTYPSEGANPNGGTGLDALVKSQDLKQEPLSPQGPKYDYKATPGSCAGTSLSPCTDVKVSNALLDPAVAGNVWCFRSLTGKAAEMPAADCVP